jgi:hypothetical protein
MNELEELLDEAEGKQDLAPTTVFEKRANQILNFCKNLLIVTRDDFEFADKKIVEAATLKKGVKEWSAPVVKKTKEAYDEAKKQRDNLIKPIDEGTTILGHKMMAWKKMQNRIAAEALQKEQDRVAAEHKKKCEEEAKRLKAAGADKETVKAVKEFAKEAPTVEAAAVQTLKSKTGLDVKWNFRIDQPELVPREFCKPDEAKIRAAVKLKANSTVIPGVTIFEDVKLTKRSER